MIRLTFVKQDDNPSNSHFFF